MLSNSCTKLFYPHLNIILFQKDNFITERFSMNLIHQRHLLHAKNFNIYHLKKFHNVNLRSADDPDESEMVCVIGQKDNVYAFITALVPLIEDATLNGNTSETVIFDVRELRYKRRLF